MLVLKRSIIGFAIWVAATLLSAALIEIMFGGPRPGLVQLLAIPATAWICYRLWWRSKPAPAAPQ